MPLVGAVVGGGGGGGTRGGGGGTSTEGSVIVETEVEGGGGGSDGAVSTEGDVVVVSGGGGGIRTEGFVVVDVGEVVPVLEVSNVGEVGLGFVVVVLVPELVVDVGELVGLAVGSIGIGSIGCDNSWTPVGSPGTELEFAL